MRLQYASWRLFRRALCPPTEAGWISSMPRRGRWAGRRRPDARCLGKAPVRHPARRHWLLAGNPIPGRHHARDLRAAGFHRAAGRASPATAPQPHPLPRRICAQQPVSWPDHAGPPGAGREAQNKNAGASRRTHTGRATGSDARWAQRLKRVFQVDVETCPICGGTFKVIASIEDPPIIERILRHLAGKDLPGLWPERPHKRSASGISPLSVQAG